MQIVRRAGENDVVFLGSLQQTIKQRFVGFGLLLNDVVIDRCLVLRSGCTALLFERSAERLLAVERSCNAPPVFLIRLTVLERASWMSFSRTRFVSGLL